MNEIIELIYDLKISNDLKTIWKNYIVMIYEDKVPEAVMTSIILYSYIAMNSLLVITFREVMIQYFNKIGVNTAFLDKTKWLPHNVNINSKQWVHILGCQPFLADIAQNTIFIDAIRFFTDSEDKGLDRNTIAHDIVTSHKKLKYINIIDIRMQTTIIVNSLVSIEQVVLKLKSQTIS